MERPQPCHKEPLGGPATPSIPLPGPVPKDGERYPQNDKRQ
jgi:hypothetical protein